MKNRKFVIIAGEYMGFKLVITVLGLKNAIKEYNRIRAQYGDNTRMAEVILDYGEEI